MAKVISEKVKAFYYQYPNIAIVVTSHGQGKDNAMAVGFHARVSVLPPYYGIGITSNHFTYELITKTKEFGVNFLPFEEVRLVASVGGCTGREVDKFQMFKITKEEPIKTKVPILKAAYLSYECKLVEDKGYDGFYRWLVGEIVAMHCLSEAITPQGILNLEKVSPLQYLGRGLYITTSKDTIKHLDHRVYGKMAVE